MDDVGLADMMASYRDRQTAPSGSSSRIVSTKVIGGSRLEFEMTLSLVGDEASPSLLNDPELSRRTLVVVLDGEVDDNLTVLWAGAKQSQWDAADGALIRQAADTFALRSPSS